MFFFVQPYIFFLESNSVVFMSISIFIIVWLKNNWFQKTKLLNTIRLITHIVKLYILIYIYLSIFQFNMWLSLTIFFLFINANNSQFILRTHASTFWFTIISFFNVKKHNEKAFIFIFLSWFFFIWPTGKLRLTN